MKLVNAIKKLEKEGYNIQQVREDRYIARMSGRRPIELGSDSDGEVVGISVGIGYPQTVTNAIRKSKEPGTGFGS